MSADNPQKEMSFFDHIEELRWHIFRSLIVLAVLTALAFANKHIVFDQFILGPTSSDFFTFSKICEWINALCIKEFKMKFQETEMAGQFLSHLKTSLAAGFIVAFPYITWEIWRFVRPALFEQEIRNTRFIGVFITLLFFCGCLFGYFILTPFAVSFFYNYTVSDLVINRFTLSSYTGYFSMFLLTSGILFELPVIVFFLSRMGLVGPDLMREYRKHALVGILVLAAIITPADPGTQLVVFFPIWILYEISIFVSAAVYKEREPEIF